MEKSVATAMINSLQTETVGAHLNSLHSLTDRLTSDVDRKEFRRHLGAVMAALNTDIVLPIIRHYPDLDPDK